MVFFFFLSLQRWYVHKCAPTCAHTEWSSVLPAGIHEAATTRHRVSAVGGKKLRGVWSFTVQIELKMNCLFSKLVLGMCVRVGVASKPTSAASLASELFSGVVTVLQMRYVHHIFPFIYVFDLSLRPQLFVYTCAKREYGEKILNILDPQRKVFRFVWWCYLFLTAEIALLW